MTASTWNINKRWKNRMFDQTIGHGRRYTHSNENEFVNLANAIVLQAALDYREALTWPPDSMRRRRNISELKGFFRSEWCGVLTNLDGDALMERLEKEAGVLYA